MICTCSELHLNGSRSGDTGAFEWRPTCEEHGLKSEWWKTTGKARQAEQNEKAKEMQARARHARTGEWPAYWSPLHD